LPITVGSAGNAAAGDQPASNSARHDRDNRDVCLIRDRKWVLAGGKDLLQLFDYDKGEVLQTWDD
jgi:hypothetical protein